MVFDLKKNLIFLKMSAIYDERYGDIFFEEEDPTSEYYNPNCCRDVYLDLVNGVFDMNLDEDNDGQYDEEEEYYDEYYFEEEETEFDNDY